MDNREKHILIEAAKLYKKFGIKSITMDDVAQHLAISKKTLYQYVHDKAELVDRIIDMELRICKNGFDEILDDKRNAIDELIEVGKYIQELLKEFNPSMDFDLKKYYPEANRKLRNIRRERMFVAISNNMQKGIREGFFRSDINVELISKIQLVRIENLLENELFTFEEVTNKHFFDEIFKYHIHAITNEKGLKYFKEIKNKH